MLLALGTGPRNLGDSHGARETIECAVRRPGGALLRGQSSRRAARSEEGQDGVVADQARKVGPRARSIRVLTRIEGGVCTTLGYLPDATCAHRRTSLVRPPSARGHANARSVFARTTSSGSPGIGER